jgi:hypothetical protein
MAYASGEHRQALFATGVVLFILIMCLNMLANVLTGHFVLWRRDVPRRSLAVPRGILFWRRRNT